MRSDPEKKKFRSAPAGTAFCLLSVVLILLILAAGVQAEEAGLLSATFHYSGASKEQQTITIEYSDDWLLQPDTEYNHKLMQASFGLAAAGFRDKEHDLSQKDYNILDFFDQLGFEKPRTEDFNRITTINTIGTAMAHKKIGDVTVIAVSVSGNNYQNEWQSNLTVDDENRPEGFNSAAEKVEGRLWKYIEDNELSGRLRLWISGYSRAAAVSNITAADVTDSGKFEAVFGYTIATPRTTRDTDAGRYRNIFNIINPFDPVPLVPYPEWGFVRYGTDLFLPSQETDSKYAEKKVLTDAYCMEAKGRGLHYNPQVNAQLHTIMDFSLFFINSANSYKGTFQSGILDFWKNRSLDVLVGDILSRLSSLPEITKYQFDEFFGMMDYLMQVAYTDLTITKYHHKNRLWDTSLSLQENLMHEHYDESYRCWLFSTDDPDSLFMNDPRYIHYSVRGDVDAEVYDMDNRFVLRIGRDGKISEDVGDAQIFREREIVQSPVKLFGFRQDEQTQIFLPMDQEYMVILFSPAEQEISASYVMYSAKELRGNVQYTIHEKMNQNDLYYGNVNPAALESLSDEDMLEYGFSKVEPWSREVVYSPAALAKLENDGVFHPSPAVFLTFGGLILMLGLYLLVLAIAGMIHGVKKTAKVIRARRAARNSAAGDESGDKTDALE